MNNENLHKGHRSRLREKYITNGAESLFEHEILEIILFSSIKRNDTNETAHRLIDKFGSLGNVLEADVEELMSVKGVGRVSAEYINIISSFRNLFRESYTVVETILTYDEKSRFFSKYFSENSYDDFIFVIVNKSDEVIHHVCFDKNDVLSGKVSTKYISEVLIMNNAENVVIGIGNQSSMNRFVIRIFSIINHISQSLSKVGIKLLDCVICGDDSVFSMKQKTAFNF